MALHALEANPRASRIASKPPGWSSSACRLAARGRRCGAPRPAAERPPSRSASSGRPVRALPRGAIRCSATRSTGEVMASASDPPTAFAEAARGRTTAADDVASPSSPCASQDKPAVVPVAAALAGLGFKLVATGGTARTLAGEQASRSSDREGRRGRRGDASSTSCAGAKRHGDQHAVRRIAAAHRRLPHPRGGVVARIPCITTISGAAAAVHAIANARTELALSLQERIDVETRAANGQLAAEAVGPYTWPRVRAAREAIWVSPASSSCSRRRVGRCRGR